jgi:hypothetical protein
MVALAMGAALTIEELLLDPQRRQHAAMPETDALTIENALQEADLRSIRYDLNSTSLLLLLDLRNALQFRLPDVGILALRGISSIEITEINLPARPWFTRYVMHSKPDTQNKHFTFELDCLDGLVLNATSQSAEFFVGNIPNLPAAPPNFGDDEESVIVAGMPHWSSDFVPQAATFIDRHPDHIQPAPNGGRSYPGGCVN